MSDKQVFRLNDSNKSRAEIIEAVMNAPVGFKVVIQPETRTDEQNSRFHATCGEVSKQILFNERKLALPQWKVLFISGHAIATGLGADMVQGLENEVVNIRESSAQMSIKRMASVIEYTTAWAVDNGVRLRADKRYEEYV
jgi:hypothetical protein